MACRVYFLLGTVRCNNLFSVVAFTTTASSASLYTSTTSMTSLLLWPQSIVKGHSLHYFTQRRPLDSHICVLLREKRFSDNDFVWLLDKKNFRWKVAEIWFHHAMRSIFKQDQEVFKKLNHEKIAKRLDFSAKLLMCSSIYEFVSQNLRLASWSYCFLGPFLVSLHKSSILD